MIGDTTDFVVAYSSGDVKPSKAYPTDLGYDLKSDVDMWIRAKEWGKVPTGVSVLNRGALRILPTNPAEWRDNVEVRGRSGLASRGILCHTGTIDPGYTGEIAAILFNLSDTDLKINRGDRIAQLFFTHQGATIQFLPYSYPDVSILDDLISAHLGRGPSGFGSSGR